MVNSVLNGACIDLCVAGNWSRVSFGSYLQCDLPGWDDPEGASYIWKERQATQRGFKISGDVFCPNQQIYWTSCTWLILISLLSETANFLHPLQSFSDVLRLQERSGGDNRFGPLTAPPAATHTHPTTTPVFSYNKKQTLLPLWWVLPWWRAGQSSLAVVGKSRTTGSFQPTRVSSTIAKHCGRAHHICVTSRARVTRHVSSLHGNQWYLRWDNANRSDP